jgi:hypothetical protein
MKNKIKSIAFIMALFTVSFSVYSQPWLETGNTPATGNFLGTTGNQPLLLRTLNLPRAQITSGGFLGVGDYQVFTPNEMLHLHAVGNNDVFSQFTNGFTLSTATDGFRIGTTSAGIAELRQYENADMNFFTANTQRMTILGTNGFVGVHTAAPQFMLEVAGEVAAEKFILRSPSGKLFAITVTDGGILAAGELPSDN